MKDEPVEDEITEDNVINKAIEFVLDRVEAQEKELESLKHKYEPVEPTAPEKEAEPVENGVKQFIEISTRTIGGEEVNSVSARDLYLDLGLSANNWTRWQKDNILESEFFKQDVDFVKLLIMSSAENPNPPKDYAVTIEFAKHIAMMAKTQRAHDYRNYFIECEKKAHEKTAHIEPPTQSRLTEVKHTKPLLILSTS